ncbi:hypothetical protein F5Y14DRAFT_427053 [Nemania sp. NC0429]|nr:hypothetical protein F5Y14DRAFT_427053 [Nemania sp. NC0429]
MKSLTSPSLALLAAGTVFAQSSPCPFNYPATLNATQSHNGLIFTIISGSPVTNNRAIQLRPNPYLEGGFFAGLDATSPVLLSNLADAAVKSQGRDMYNQLYDLGPTAYLNLRDEINGTRRYTVGVVNATTWPGEVDRQWYLIGGAPDGTYGLYHDVPIGVVNGFLLCVADHDLEPGPWYQLFYDMYDYTPTDFPECEYVGVRATVSATINNGECDIGGFVAS